ncbi:MAG: hypothetical protein ACFE0J_21895, partial [Elainellaceae cyanobacterium]
MQCPIASSTETVVWGAACPTPPHLTQAHTAISEKVFPSASKTSQYPVKFSAYPLIFPDCII